MIPCFHKKLSENRLSISTAPYKKYIVSKEYCIGHHDVGMCFFVHLQIAFILLGNVEELLRKLDPFFSHMNTWTVSTQCSCIDSMEKSLSKVVKCLLLCKVQSFLSKETDEGTECPVSPKRDSWGKSLEGFFSSAFPKTTSTQTSGSVFVERSEQVKKTKNVPEILKRVDGFLDCGDSYSSNLVTFETKPS